jgi:hypothetical protein
MWYFSIKSVFYETKPDPYGAFLYFFVYLDIQIGMGSLLIPLFWMFLQEQPESL